VDRTRRRSLIAAALAVAGSALIAPASGQAANTAGILDDGADATLNCNPGQIYSQGTTSGEVPATVDVGLPGGTPVVITSWATRSRAGGGQGALKVMSRDAFDGNAFTATYTVLHTSAVETMVANQINRFSVRIPAPGGGEIGYMPLGTTQRCRFGPTGAQQDDNVFNGVSTGEVGSQFNSNAQNTFQHINLEVTFEDDADADGFGDET